MDKEKLVEMILKAVENRLKDNQCETETVNTEITGSTEIPDNRPKILVLTRLNHSCTHCFRGDADIAENYAVQCSYDQLTEVDLTEIEEIFVRNMDTESLAKLTSGMPDTPYLKLISRAVLEGKKITIILDDLDSYKYRDTAPKTYLDMLNEKVNIVRSWGVRIEKEDIVVERLSGRKAECEGCLIEKRVLTETDLRRAYNGGNREILIKEKTIVSDMAKEFAERNAITISVIEKESL